MPTIYVLAGFIAGLCCGFGLAVVIYGRID